jgi:hypothetical protein
LAARAIGSRRVPTSPAADPGLGKATAIASLRQQRFGAGEERRDLAPPALGPLPPAPVAVVADLQHRLWRKAEVPGARSVPRLEEVDAERAELQQRDQDDRQGDERRRRRQ